MSLIRRLRYQKWAEQVALTPEGFVYLIVLCFITVGSVLRNVNLLILMAGMMYAPLLINWRLAVRRLRSFQAHRILPQRIHANRLVNIQWECEYQRRGIAAFNVLVEDQLCRAEDTEQDLNRKSSGAGIEGLWGWQARLRQWWRQRNGAQQPSQVRIRFPKLVAGHAETQSFRAFLGKRGKYLAGPAAVSTSFPFGLIQSRSTLDDGETFFVGPELGQLEPTWEQRMQSTAVGSDSIKRTRTLQDDEFFGLRPWRSGDSRKHIHWRTTAKQGFPIIKQHDQQNNRDFALILDLQAHPDDEAARQRCEAVLSFAASVLLQLGTQVQGQVCVAVWGRDQEFCRSRSPQGVIGEVMPMLAVAQADESPPIIDAIIRAQEAVSSGTPLYVISSRPRPASLELMLPSTVEEEGEPEGRSPEHQRRRLRMMARRLKLALPLVRWVDTDSTAFRSIFTLPSMEHGSPQMPVGLDKVSRKWLTDV